MFFKKIIVQTMKKTIFIIVSFSVICGNLFSQTDRKLSEDEKQVFEQKMIEHSKKIKTLQCAFAQEKTSDLVSEKALAKGVLLCQLPSMLRWERTEPTPLTLILNENDAVLFDKHGKKTGNEKMLEQVGGILISMVDGTGITQNELFSSEFHEIDDTQILIILTPVEKHVKDFCNKIELRIDRKTMLGNHITLEKRSGDKMIILLTDIILNAEIPQNKFVIK